MLSDFWQRHAVRVIHLKLSVCLCLIGFSCTIYAKSEVQWLHPDFAPYHIVTGGHKGLGALDMVESSFVSVMPQFEHTLMTATFSRLLHQIDTTDNACSVTLLKTPEREKYILYSEPYLLVEGSRVIVRREQLPQLQPYFTSADRFDLNAFLATQHFRVGISPGRYYGDDIQPVLNMHERQLVIPAGVAQLTHQLHMLLADPPRLDAVIGLPLEVEYLLKNFHASPESVEMLTVIGEHSFQLAHVGCSQSALGQEVIIQVNARIAAGDWREFTQIMAKYIPPSRRQLFEKVNNDYFSNHQYP